MRFGRAVLNVRNGPENLPIIVRSAGRPRYRLRPDCHRRWRCPGRAHLSPPDLIQRRDSGPERVSPLDRPWHEYARGGTRFSPGQDFPGIEDFPGIPVRAAACRSARLAKTRQASALPPSGFIHSFNERCISGDLSLSLSVQQALYRRPPRDPNNDQIRSILRPWP